jgi:hypothetical protein
LFISFIDAIAEEVLVKTERVLVEKKIGLAAIRLVDLCALSRPPFKLCADQCQFKFLGGTTVAQPDTLIVQSTSKNFVVIFEDKSGYFKGDGYLGQIVFELLRCHYHNYYVLKNGDVPKEIYLIRCYLYYVSFFSMHIEEEVLGKICHDGVLSQGKLTLVSDNANPMQEKGYNLLNKSDRSTCIRLLEAIKAKCVAGK